MSLSMGMDLPGWPPENIEELSKNMRILLKYNETRFKTKKTK
jgi:hypothetical protein